MGGEAAVGEEEGEEAAEEEEVRGAAGVQPDRPKVIVLGWP